MAARIPTPRYCIQLSRSTKQDGWRLWDLSLSLCGNIAVSGDNKNTHRTYIDVYSVRNSDSRDKPKIFYSKKFEKYEDKGWIYWGRYVSFVSDEVLVSCLGNKLEVFQVSKDEVLRSRRVNGEAMSLCVREREIFIGFRKSNKITVYDVIDLNEIKSLILQGIQDGYWPDDMTAIADRIFVCESIDKKESNPRSLIFDEKNGRILSELTKPTDTHWYANSIICVPLCVVAVLWTDSYDYDENEHNKIVFYSLLSEKCSSFLIVEIESGVDRIRISDRGDRMVTKNEWTGEVKVYDMVELFSYGHLKENLKSQLQADDCLKLTNFFALPEDEANVIFKSDAPTENLLAALEEKGVIQPSNVDRLAEAFTELKINSSCPHLVYFYQQTRTPAFYKATIQARQGDIHMLHSEKEQMKRRLETAKENKTQLQSLLQEVQELKQRCEATEMLLHQTKDLHQRAVQAGNTLKTERDQYHNELMNMKESFESAKEAQKETEKALFQTKELLNKATQEKIRAEREHSEFQFAMKSMMREENPREHSFPEAKKTRPPEVKRASHGSVSSASAYLPETVIADEFSKLLVRVSVKLTNTHCVLLAHYFNFPPSKIDIIEKDYEKSGITLFGIMKERNVINMYDITRLQQALVDLELKEINETLVIPYQRRIDPSKCQQHRVNQRDY